MTSLMWFRRDLRLSDHPALNRAGADGDVVGLFVVDPVLWDASSAVRRAYLTRSLQALDADMGGTLLVRIGDPVAVVPEVARQVAAGSVHVSSDFGHYGRVRDQDVDLALGSIPLVRTGSPFAVAPGTVRKDDGSPYQVFTPYYRAWLRQEWSAPAPTASVRWLGVRGDRLPASGEPGLSLPAAGERAAWERWAAYRSSGSSAYAESRNRPDLDATSRMSTALKWGEVHPRSLLAELTDDDEAWRRQLCWRDFYADVLLHRPLSLRASLDTRYDDPSLWRTGEQAQADLEAWAGGRTGYPMVDAGMRQLRAEGWMHNRVRMIVASFLVKDLHLPWQSGAREFNRWLTDADTANNAHGWQWTAGCGTDASPYYRVFNPVGQGLKFDPDGDYVRRYVPELRHLVGAAAHEPWEQVDGYAHGYPERMVDHAVERQVALDLLERIKAVPR